MPSTPISRQLDSDTALERNAMEEALKPFAHRRVHPSPVEIAYNAHANLLTRIKQHRQIAGR